MKKVGVFIGILLFNLSIFGQTETSNNEKLNLQSPSSVSLFQSNSTNGVWATGTITSDRWGVYEDATSAKERITILPGGNVGIGTTTPTRQLDVNGSIAGQGFINVQKGGSYVIGLNGQEHGYITGRNSSFESKFVIASNGNTYFTGGNVGVGIKTPASELHVYNGSSGGDVHSFSEVTIEDNDHTMINLLSPNDKIGYYGFSDTDDNFLGGMQYEHSVDRLNFRVNNHSSDMVIDSKGNIGIGTTNPTQKLDVKGTARVGNGDWGALIVDGKEKNDWLLNAHNGGDAFAIRTQRDNGEADWSYNVMTFKRSTGNVGIGTIAPDAKLTVKGKIHAEEVKIDLSVPAPDYVFLKDYDLKTIDQVEAYIQQEGHLPNIPSAKTMETDGVELGLMNMKLLEKIEELTLYTIAQEKKLAKQSKEISELQKTKAKNQELEERLTKIEELLSQNK